MSNYVIKEQGSNSDGVKLNKGQTSTRVFLFILFSVLSCYYLWVLYLIATPQVSLSYKTYYIDKKTRYWGRDSETFKIPSSGVVDLSQKSPLISREGWTKKTQQGFRTLKSEGGIYFSSIPLGKKTIAIKIKELNLVSNASYFLNGIKLSSSRTLDGITLSIPNVNGYLNSSNDLNYLKIKSPIEINISSVVFQ
ncbi:hypothetical protein Q8W40_00200 [Vibrio penaeicida]|uniref:hypothetical protein n=1 Tax=Vibrio penaeicida TaxID=104609 RepID=UPI0027372118|nr:hypothetical protein [Vibrio penaeicida]MDP2570582.1 hypothetical protein [Vibrio penaeicida]